MANKSPAPFETAQFNQRLNQPSYTQGLIRWWNNDKKQDIHYLFHAIRRYFIWYKTQDHKIFNFILEKAIIGLNKLIETYKKCDERSILQTLSLYKNVLELFYHLFLYILSKYHLTFL